MNIVIVGGGHMGLTYAQSFLRSHVSEASQICILERSADRLASLRLAFAGKCSATAAEVVPLADLIVLAVKPQDADALYTELAPLVTAQQVVLTIMAGISMAAIQRGLQVNKVVRAMPNLPAQVGAGMTVYTSNESVTRLETAMVQNLLATTGKCIYVAEEAMLDAATAVSGSGPAYVFYFMQAAMTQARELGFSESEAELLVLQTFGGAVDLYKANDLDCGAWIRAVSSRGGTTEAAMKVYDKQTLDQNIAAGMAAAFERAKQLGDLHHD